MGGNKKKILYDLAIATSACASDGHGTIVLTQVVVTARILVDDENHKAFDSIRYIYAKLDGGNVESNAKQIESISPPPGYPAIDQV